ncbi:MAG: protein kinase, partial [Gammaproteobacteria bacterium]
NKAFEFFLQGAKLSQQLSQAEIEELSGLPVIKQEIVLTHAFVGDRYRKGLGVQKNIEQALYWLNSAAKQYDKNDKNFYEFIRKGKSILNSNDIWLNLAEIYRDGGAGVEKNPVQAIYYFNKLATIFTTYKMPERAEVYKNEAETLKLQLAIANNQTVILQNTSSPAYAHPAIASSSLMIDYGSLTIKQPALGAGAFGEVYYAECGYEKYAVKQLRMQNLDENALNDLKKEAQIMANLDSEFIIRLRGICIKPYCIVMEFAPKGTLYKYLHSDETIPWERCLKIAIGIGKGLSYLYSQNPQILHRDLKSANVLLNDNYQALLSDFGLSKLKSESSSKVTMGAAGTPAWMAPELFGDKPHHTVEADIYSYAIVLWELATRKDPYEGLSMMQIMGKLYHNERPDFPENACSEAYRKTVTNAWRKEPSERSSLKTIIDDLSQQLGNKDKASETGNQSIGNLGAPSTDLPAQSTGFLGAPSMVK